MLDLLKGSFVLLLIFRVENAFSNYIRYPQPFSLNKEATSDQIPATTNQLTYPILYPLTGLSMEPDSEDIDSGTDETKNIEHVHTQKILKTPLAFSYNSEIDDDLKSAATQEGADEEHQEVEGHEEGSTHEDVKVGHAHKGGGGHGGGGGGGGGHGHGGGGGGGHGKHESGGGKSHHSEHHAKGGEKEDKGYKGHHVHEKSSKGHHDKEGHKGSYSDEGGKKQNHFNEHDYKGEHHKGDKGEKGSKFEESGKHEKGHSTKGGHSVNKKDHYEKKHEFFDEYYEGGEHEKHGGFHSQKDYHKGGSEKGGHHKSGHHDSHYGKKGHSEKGGHHSENKGHKDEAGHKEHHSHLSKHGKKGDKSVGKKWGYKHGDGGGGGGGHGHGGGSGHGHGGGGGGGHGHGGGGGGGGHHGKYEAKDHENIQREENDEPAEEYNENEETKNSYQVQEPQNENIEKKTDNEGSALETLETIVKGMELGRKPPKPKQGIYNHNLDNYNYFKLQGKNNYKSEEPPKPIPYLPQVSNLDTIAFIIKRPTPTPNPSQFSLPVFTNIDKSAAVITKEPLYKGKNIEFPNSKDNIESIEETKEINHTISTPTIDENAAELETLPEPQQIKLQNNKEELEKQERKLYINYNTATDPKIDYKDKRDVRDDTSISVKVKKDTEQIKKNYSSCG